MSVIRYGVVLWWILSLVVLAGCSSEKIASRCGDVPESTRGHSPAYLKINGTTYYHLPDKEVLPQDVGELVGRIECTPLDTVTLQELERVDGDAAFLAPGTPVLAIDEYSPTFRVAVPVDRRFRTYQAGSSDTARYAGDFMDIRGRVTSMAFYKPLQEEPLYTVETPGAVEHLVELLLASPYVRDAPFDMGDGQYLILYLDDGTEITHLYYPLTGQLSPGILLPQDFQTTLSRLHAISP